MHDLNDIAANEAFVRTKTAEGLVADFSDLDGWDEKAKPKISAAFLRRLMLGQEKDAKVLMPGVRVRGAWMVGDLDLADCAGAGGQGLPALALEKCDLPGRINLSGARVARLSINDSRFRELWGNGIGVDGDFTFIRAEPAPAEVGGDGTAHIRLRAAHVDGDVYGRGATLVQPLVWPSHFAQGDKSVLYFQSADISGNLLIDADDTRRFTAEGRVQLYGAKIGGTLSCCGARFDGKDEDAIVGDNLSVGGAVLLRADGETRFEAEGSIRLLGATIAGDLELSGATMKAEGYALMLKTARIGGEFNAYDNTEIEGAIDLSGARIGRLRDDPATAWGDSKSKALIDLNEIELDKVGAQDQASRPLWKARAAWLRRNTGLWYGTKSAFSNQPWRQVAAAYDRAGLHKDARYLRRAEQCEALKVRPLWQQPFIWFFAEFLFGYGLSVSRALVTVLAVWAIGVGGVIWMNEKGALVAAQAPDKPERACTQVQPALYALDTMIPVLDLRQESACEPGRAPGSNLPIGMGEYRVFEEIAVWRWAKAIYAILAAAAVGFALLTWTGVFRPRGKD